MGVVLQLGNHLGHIFPEIHRSELLFLLLFSLLFSGQNSCLNSFFLTNVPYNFLPPFPDHYIALGDREIFVFKPREWRGVAFNYFSGYIFLL